MEGKGRIRVPLGCGSEHHVNGRVIYRGGKQERAVLTIKINSSFSDVAV
jgi:hypothetical protein